MYDLSPEVGSDQLALLELPGNVHSNIYGELSKIMPDDYSFP
jgi:hypothetical protein